MSERNSRVRQRAREDARDGHPMQGSGRVYEEAYREEQEEMAREQIDREDAASWRRVVLEPLAERFDATPELMEELFDAIADFVKKGKAL